MDDFAELLAESLAAHFLDTVVSSFVFLREPDGHRLSRAQVGGGLLFVDFEVAHDVLNIDLHDSNMIRERLKIKLKEAFNWNKALLAVA